VVSEDLSVPIKELDGNTQIAKQEQSFIERDRKV
jgi:hypothetical protein